MKEINIKITWLTLFSIAMGFMETAIVIYLRKIYYPHGFQFPLIPIDAGIGVVEFLREAATITMLLGIGILTGKTSSQKFAIFIYCFAVWDLFYYLFLKILIDWPESLFTWDILFLIPVPWVGPVIVPCIVSVTMISLSLCIIYFQAKGRSTKISLKEWVLLSSGSLVVILSCMWDYFTYIGNSNSKNIWMIFSGQSMFHEIANYIPMHYNWLLFLMGEGIIVYGIILFVKRIKK